MKMLGSIFKSIFLESMESVDFPVRLRSVPVNRGNQPLPPSSSFLRRVVIAVHGGLPGPTEEKCSFSFCRTEQLTASQS